MGKYYIEGTLVERRDHYVYVKTPKGLMPQHRWVAEREILGRDLREGEVVIRRLPNRANNSPENLVVVQHSLVKYKYLPHSRIIFVPPQPRKSRPEAVAV